MLSSSVGSHSSQPNCCVRACNGISFSTLFWALAIIVGGAIAIDQILMHHHSVGGWFQDKQISILTGGLMTVGLVALVYFSYLIGKKRFKDNIHWVAALILVAIVLTAAGIYNNWANDRVITVLKDHEGLALGVGFGIIASYLFFKVKKHCF